MSILHYYQNNNHQIKKQTKKQYTIVVDRLFNKHENKINEYMRCIDQLNNDGKRNQRMKGEEEQMRQQGNNGEWENNGNNKGVNVQYQRIKHTKQDKNSHNKCNNHQKQQQTTLKKRGSIKQYIMRRQQQQKHNNNNTNHNQSSNNNSGRYFQVEQNLGMGKYVQNKCKEIFKGIGSSMNVMKNILNRQQKDANINKDSKFRLQTSTASNQISPITNTATALSDLSDLSKKLFLSLKLSRLSSVQKDQTSYANFDSDFITGSKRIKFNNFDEFSQYEYEYGDEDDVYRMYRQRQYKNGLDRKINNSSMINNLGLEGNKVNKVRGGWGDRRL